MSNTDNEKSNLRRNFPFRLNVFFFIVFVLFSILIIKLAILQFVEGPTLSENGNKKGTRNVLTAPIRGNIFDSTGKPITYSTSTQSLYFSISPNFKKSDANDLATRLYDVFTKQGDNSHVLSVEDIIRQMDLDFKINTISTPRRIKTNLTNTEIAYFMEHRSLFPGIDIVEESIRNYSKDSVAVQLVGYVKKYKGVSQSMEKYKDVNKDNDDPSTQYLDNEEVGVDGLEFMYEDYLRGKNGVKQYPVNNAGQIIGPVQITNPQKGDDLYLTINQNVQLATEQAITEQINKIRTSTNSAERAPNAKIGFAVAMEVQTGKVIAMASMPDYDPNIWSVGSISNDDYKNIMWVMNNGTIRQVYPQYSDQELKKHPSSLVPPGSTMKPLSVLIGLNEKLFTINSTYSDTGSFSFGKKGHETYVRNASGHVYGLLDPSRAIAKSSNPFMAAMVGNQLYIKDGKKGLDIWDNYMQQFGLGVLTGSGLLGEQAGIKEYYNEYKSSGSAQSPLVYASFGQQGRYTTLQLVQYVATLASRGNLIKPQFVEKIVSSSGSPIQTFKPEVMNTIDLPDKYWDEIESGMRQVSVQGFEGFKYNFLRKTGTSQQQVGGKTIDNGVFIASAPAENPKLAVAVVIPEGGFGGWSAAPIARKIFEAYDKEIGLSE
ncbi:peptidoglycan D,D-transpeptidase FtsI family protein [Paenibacillus glycanilyticus]|uniref:peptidoglycan D,D-transpeptidase FtsI family protein n=1 Tax=Paenibacillus glycanilyticus TaxID=126569 RepID=UPI00191061C3|nr:penicillin-binding transpeptidase domain-containing protein [Paenibacillus glycanilyticus]